MRLLCITDLHYNLRSLERILAQEPPADVLLLGGDLTDFHSPREAAAVLDRAAGHSRQLLAVAGNCDSAEIDAYLEQRGVSLHGRGRVFGEVGFFGLSAMPTWQGTMYEFSEGELEGFLAAGQREAGAAPRTVLLSHAPPFDSGVDRLRNGARVGSRAVRAAVEAFRPMLVVCGHIHEGRGLGEVAGLPVANCGPGRGGFYVVVELDLQAQVSFREA